MQQDLFYMNRCLELARLGMGTVAPNPMVGAVLVYDNRVIGEGWHACYGQAHAEVNCINSVETNDKAFISLSTLYVSLEPCAHFGKTPPCADLIIRHKIPKVVIGCIDTYAKVRGLGIQKLKNAGIKVFLDGPWNESCQQLNRRFFTFHWYQRPFILLKWAQSADHFMAGAGQQGAADRTKISHSLTDRLVHRWRSQEAAILVGKNTALLDNPALNNRLWTGPNPIRIVIDKELQIPASAQIFQSPGKVLVFNQIKSAEDKLPTLTIQWQQLKWDQPIIPQLLGFCYQQNIQSILVEGGAQLFQAFLEAELWDECLVITNTGLNLKNGIPAPELTNAKLVKVKCLGQDKISYFAAQRG